MLAKQMKKAMPKKEAKDPLRDWLDSLYWMSKRPAQAKGLSEALRTARFGFPAVGFKCAMVDACRHCEGVTMAMARGAFHVVGELTMTRRCVFLEESGEFKERDKLVELVQVHGTPMMDEEPVRVGMGTADLRYRAMFPQWWVKLTISYNASSIGEAQVLNLLNIAGFAQGLGEWRPEKNGTYGRFHVATEADLKDFKLAA